MRSTIRMCAMKFCRWPLAEVDSVAASLNYLTPSAEKPATYTFTPPEGKPQTFNVKIVIAQLKAPKMKTRGDSVDGACGE